MHKNTSSQPDLPDDVVLSVRHVSKKFCRNLRRSMLYGMQDLARNMLGLRPKAEGGNLRPEGGQDSDSGLRSQVSSFLPPLRKAEFWALSDINFSVKRGETLGLIGDNGSGKSTLLRLLTGIFPPDGGMISVRGRVGALIALGAGFHPHMTGRENIYLNGSVLGMAKEEIQARFDDIVNFAEIGDFLDAPVTTFSSGMHARLGFSIAIHVNPDLLLVDEVLSVGDMAFQVKCRKKMTDYVDQGGAVVFVSHNLNVVESLCRRCIWLDQGHLLQDGPIAEVLCAYQDRLDRRLMEISLQDMRKRNTGTGDIRIVGTMLRNDRGEEAYEFAPGGGLTVELHFETSRPVRRPYLWVAVCSQRSSLFAANMLFDGFRPEFLEGKGMIACAFQQLPLLPSVYTLMGGIRTEDGATMLIESRVLGSFRIVGNGQDIGLVCQVAESMTRDAAPVLVPYEWHLPDGSVHAQKFNDRFG